MSLFRCHPLYEHTQKKEHEGGGNKRNAALPLKLVAAIDHNDFIDYPTYPLIIVAQ